MRFVLVNNVMAEWPKLPEWLTQPPQTTFSQSAGNAIGEWIAAKGQALLTLLNVNSPEIITFAIVFCAGGIMLAPMLGSSASKWTGKLFTVLWAGIIWRVIV